jgi:ADP-heptose:LPS heptosyltransferase
VNEQYASFVRSTGAPCEVHSIRRAESVLGFLKAVVFVRRLKTDLALSMSPPKRNAAVTLTSGAPRKVGYLTYVHSLTPYLESTPVESFGCTLPRREFYGLENIEERSLKVCKSLGILSESVQHRVDLDENITDWKWSALCGRYRLPRKKFVVMHPFSGWKFRSWSIERFNQLAQKILLLLDYGVVFLCEKGEEKLLDASKQRFAQRDDVFFFASDDLVETAALVRHASLFVGNDSGPLHLAAALGVRVVGLFGPASPQLTAPRNAIGVLHYERVECSPCNQCTCIRPTDSCMTLISPEYVFESVKRLLSRESAVEVVANA